LHKSSLFELFLLLFEFLFQLLSRLLQLNLLLLTTLDIA
jgi:hypothetical protein